MYPESDVDNGWPSLDVDVVALDIRPLEGGCRAGDEWCDNVSGLTITALGEAGDGRSTGSPTVDTQLSNKWNKWKSNCD